MMQNAPHRDQPRDAWPFGFDRHRATAGNPWLRWRLAGPGERHLLSVAELAECTCPDLCNRDHANE